MRRVWWLLVLGLAACGNDDGDDAADGTDSDTEAPGPTGPTGDTDPTGPTAGDVVEVDIVAADGGMVEAFGAVLDIPPGALAADTTITVAIAPSAGLPDAGTLLGDVLDLGPDGTVFDPPATLTLPTSSAPGTGEAHVVSWLDGAAWVDLPSTVGANEVSAEVAHFTSFSARLIAATQVCGYTACGGDPVGDWVPVGICSYVDSEALVYGCEFLTETTFTVSGGYHIDANGTWSYQTSAGTHAWVETIPPECVPPDAATCDDLYPATPYEPRTCTGDVATGCVCTGENDVWPYPLAQGTWTTSGAELSLTTDVQGPKADFTNVVTYCVTGDVLTTVDPDSYGSVYSYQRL